MTLEIYDAFGQLRTDYTADEIAAIDSDGKILRLEALIVAAKNKTDADAALAKANQGVRDAMATLDGVKKQKAVKCPAMSQYEAWQHNLGLHKNQSGAVVATSGDAEPGARNSEGDDAQTGELTLEQWDAAISFAEGKVDGARALLNSCKDNVTRRLEQVRLATIAWQAEYPPVDFNTNLKREFAFDLVRKEALVAKGLPADWKPPRAKPQSMVDAVAQHSHGGDANFKGGSGFRRGAHPRAHYGTRVAPKPKLPSDR